MKNIKEFIIVARTVLFCTSGTAIGTFIGQFIKFGQIYDIFNILVASITSFIILTPVCTLIYIEITSLKITTKK